MGDRILLKSSKITDIFTKMSYGENYESFNKATEWLKCRDNIFVSVEKSGETHSGIPKEVKNIINNEKLYTIYVPEVDTLKLIVSKHTGKSTWTDTAAFERTRLLHRLALEIEKNSDTFTQLEMIVRGILAKDTKMKAVPLLANYFNFYSGFSVKYNAENPKFKSGVSVGVISNENSLSNIGMYLAPALAAGYKIVLQVGTKIFPVVQLITELVEKVGIPQDIIKLIPSDEGELLPYLNCDNIEILTLMVDLNNERYRGINVLNKKIISLTSYKIPIIVFDSADLDSACENVIESVWGYKGLNLWSADTILIQENIFTTFLDKLKTKLKSLRVGQSHDKTVDISNAFDNLNLIMQAQNQGLEVFNTNDSGNGPCLIIGGRVQTKKHDSLSDTNAATVLQFRSIDEAVNLANNNRQGLGAMIWSENIGVINEITRKLNVSNIWINSSCGISSADATISPIKHSGIGYFGGQAGFYEYVHIKQHSSAEIENSDSIVLNKSINVAINNAKKVQDTWKKLPKINKTKIFHQFAEYIEDNRKKLSESLQEIWLNKWINSLYQCVTEPLLCSYTSTSTGYNFVTIKEPKGVIVIDQNKDLSSHNIKLILRALFEGNAVILLDESPAFNFYTEFSKKFPNGVLNVFPYNLENVKTISAHNDINAYLGGREERNPIFTFLPIQDCRLYSYITDMSESIVEKVTFTKNIWSDIGKSSTCNLGVH